MSLVEVLPLAIVMIAGPQILSPIFLATSEQWRSNSIAYVVGASLSISLVVAIAYLLGNSLGGGGGGLLGQPGNNSSMAPFSSSCSTPPWRPTESGTYRSHRSGWES